MQPQIITKPAFTVVGLLIHPKPMSPEIPSLWGQFGSRMDEVQHLAEPGVSYGLMDHFDQELASWTTWLAWPLQKWASCRLA